MKRKLQKMLTLLPIFGFQVQAKAASSMVASPVIAIMGINQLTNAAGKVLGIISIFAFILAVIVAISGGIAIKNGNAENGKNAIVAAFFIAGAATIVGIIFSIFGLDHAVVSAKFD